MNNFDLLGLSLWANFVIGNVVGAVILIVFGSGLGYFSLTSWVVSLILFNYARVKNGR